LRVRHFAGRAGGFWNCHLHGWQSHRTSNGTNASKSGSCFFALKYEKYHRLNLPVRISVCLSQHIFGLLRMSAWKFEESDEMVDEDN
jgi:hypothetical protein